MPEYRRPWVPGATYFITIVTHERHARFIDDGVVTHWRNALARAMEQKPFKIIAGVVLPDHVHLIVELPPGVVDLSSRIGLAKKLFTQAISAPPSESPSRRKHREADIWQRRFFDHLIRDEDDFIAHMDYLHYNPVKHGHVNCPGDWPWSSFHHWAKQGAYPMNWCCASQANPPDFSSIKETVGE